MKSTSQRQALCYMAAIFAAGLLAGGVAGGLVGYRFGTERLTRPLGPEAMADGVKQRLHHDLRLSPEQQEQVSPLVDRFVLEMSGVHSNTVEQAVGVIQQMHQRVAEILTPRQRERLQSIQQEREAEFRRTAHPPP
ncbi:MAG: hypothetical protein H7A47_07300 [Verrucomicrobiales bacterium]|nr:hypothetical protein [Verrucomicrobiales bacterium]